MLQRRVTRISSSSVNNGDLKSAGKTLKDTKVALQSHENHQIIKGAKSTKDSKPLAAKEFNTKPTRSSTSSNSTSSKPKLIPRRSRTKSAPLGNEQVKSTIPFPEITGIERELNCIEHLDDIMKYLKKYEQKFLVGEHFLEESNVSGKMRGILVDWIVQVHDRFHLLPETFYLCVYIIDAFLAKEEVPKTELQLLGVTALFIASKFEEMYTPDIQDFEFIADNVFSRVQIFKMEIKILKTVGFLLSRPSPIYFARYFTKRVGILDVQITNLAKYISEVSVQTYMTCHERPSFIAAVALHLAVTLVNEAEYDCKELITLTDMSKQSFDLLVSTMAAAVYANQLNQKLKGIKTKYSVVRHTQASLLTQSQLEQLSTLFQNDM